MKPKIKPRVMWAGYSIGKMYDARRGGFCADNMYDEVRAPIFWTKADAKRAYQDVRPVLVTGIPKRRKRK